MTIWGPCALNSRGLAHSPQTPRAQAWPPRASTWRRPWGRCAGRGRAAAGGGRRRAPSSCAVVVRPTTRPPCPTRPPQDTKRRRLAYSDLFSSPSKAQQAPAAAEASPRAQQPPSAEASPKAQVPAAQACTPKAPIASPSLSNLLTPNTMLRLYELPANDATMPDFDFGKPVISGLDQYQFSLAGAELPVNEPPSVNTKQPRRRRDASIPDSPSVIQPSTASPVPSLAPQQQEPPEPQQQQQQPEQQYDLLQQQPAAPGVQQCDPQQLEQLLQFLPLLPPLLRPLEQPASVMALAYKDTTYTSIKSVPDGLLQTPGKLLGVNGKIYMHTVTYGDVSACLPACRRAAAAAACLPALTSRHPPPPPPQMCNLLISTYTMSRSYKPAQATKIMHGLNEKYSFKSFLYSDKMSALHNLENDFMLLPLDAPMHELTPALYQEHLRDQLVVLACRLPDGNTAPVAMGVFIGDEVYANTLESAYRYRGRADSIPENLAANTPVVDANRLLAPVHLLCSLPRLNEFAHFEQLAGGRLDLSPPSTDTWMPAPLQLLVANVQASPHSQVVQVLRQAMVDKTLGIKAEDRARRVLLVNTVLDAMSGRLVDADGNQLEELQLPDIKSGGCKKAGQYLHAATTRQLSFFADGAQLSKLLSM